MSAKNKSKIEWEKSDSNPFGIENFYLPKENKKSIAASSNALIFGAKCQKVCSKVIELLPEVTIDPNSGRGSSMTNIDGFRYINAYVIGERLTVAAMVNKFQKKNLYMRKANIGYTKNGFSNRYLAKNICLGKFLLR